MGKKFDYECIIPPGGKEQPFYHEGMSGEDWEEEYWYYAYHWSDVKKGTYIPLWLQKEGYKLKEPSPFCRRFSIDEMIKEEKNR